MLTKKEISALERKINSSYAAHRENARICLFLRKKKMKNVYFCGHRTTYHLFLIKRKVRRARAFPACGINLLPRNATFFLKRKAY